MHNMSDDVSTLSLLFIKDECVKASITIASRCMHSTESIACNGYVPDYIDVEKTKNVPFVSDINSIDGYTPIMIYQNRADNLSPILLLEETEYEMILSGEVESALNYNS